MHILHISNSYGGTEVYTQLIRALDKIGVRQTIFVPLNPNNRDRKGNYLIKFTVPGSTIIYSTKLKQYHRYLYSLKIIHYICLFVFLFYLLQYLYDNQDF